MKRFIWLHRLTGLLRTFSKLARYWPVWSIIALFTFSAGPYVRVNEFYNRPAYGTCLYLGAYGVIVRSAITGHGCPWLVILNSSQDGGRYER